MRTAAQFLLAVILTTLFAPHAVTAAEVTSLQALIDQAESGGEVTVPKGVWREPLRIDKPLTLRGAGRDASVVDVVSDQPAIRLGHAKGDVVLENLTVRWKRATSNPAPEAQAAIVTKDGPVRLRNLRVVAPDDYARCPSGFTADGFADVKIDGCEFKGYEFTLYLGGGASGVIADCVVAKPGHCGITAGPESRIEVMRTIVTGSRYHGLRCTGGKLNLHDNLVIANKNRGIYLGNKSATGTIRDNVIRDNGTGISAFSGTEVKIHNNLIAGSEFAGIDMRDTCRLDVARNLLVDNSRGIVLFPESGKNRNVIGKNASAGNTTETEGFPQPPPELQQVEGELASGKFEMADAKGFGLTDPTTITPVWQRWIAWRENARTDEPSRAESTD